MKKKDISKYTKNELIDLLLKKDEENSLLKNKVKNQSEQISILNRFIFAKKNEKWTKEDKTHSRTFNEAEDTASEKDDLKKGKEGKSSSHKRGKKPLPEDIPRNTVESDLNDDQKSCPCCGKPRPCIGTTPSEKLEFKLAEMTITKYLKKRYGACDCDEFQNQEDLPQVIEAKTPDQFIPGSVASPSLVAYIITSKFVDAIPLYRQERIFERIGVNISRQNMSNWSLTISKKCEVITEHIRKSLISGKLINMDETTVQVLNEKGRSAENKSYMWVMTGGESGKKAVLFNYSPTRKQEVPMGLLQKSKN